MDHRYWSVVENCALPSGKTEKRTVSYLVEINDMRELARLKSLEIFGEDKRRSLSLSMFPLGPGAACECDQRFEGPVEGASAEASARVGLEVRKPGE